MNIHTKIQLGLAIIAAVIVSLLFAHSSPKPPKLAGVGGPTYFAQVASDGSGLVLRVIVADQNFIDSGLVGDPKNWIQTYQDGTRKKYAGLEYTYDKILDAFIPPKTNASWTLNQATGNWIPPYTPVPAIIKIATTSL